MKSKVLISVSGGVAEVVACPENIEVDLRDFDNNNHLEEGEEETPDFTEEEIKEAEKVPNILAILQRLDIAASRFADDHAHYYETGNHDKINSMLAELHNAHLAAKELYSNTDEL